jgi:hypothetical protein
MSMFDTDEEGRRQMAAMEISRREIQRKSLDTIRVFNPLANPFRFQWDGFWHSVPANGTKDLPRYLAMHYFKKIAEYMIGQQALKEGEELLKLREKQFGKTFIDKYEENKEVWDRVPKMNDPDLLTAIRDTVVLGLVEEYGYDMPEPGESTPQIDFRSLEEQIFAGANKRIDPDFMPSKADVLQEMTTEGDTHGRS